MWEAGLCLVACPSSSQVFLTPPFPARSPGCAWNPAARAAPLCRQVPTVPS